MRAWSKNSKLHEIREIVGNHIMSSFNFLSLIGLKVQKFSDPIKEQS